MSVPSASNTINFLSTRVEQVKSNLESLINFTDSDLETTAEDATNAIKEQTQENNLLIENFKKEDGHASKILHAGIDSEEFNLLLKSLDDIFCFKASTQELQSNEGFKAILNSFDKSIGDLFGTVKETIIEKFADNKNLSAYNVNDTVKYKLTKNRSAEDQNQGISSHVKDLEPLTKFLHISKSY